MQSTMAYHHNYHAPAHFSTDPSGLQPAGATPIVDLADGDTFDLVAAPVRKRIGDNELRMLAYNGSIPGPTLRVRQGSSVTIRFTNRTDMENTVHWHGVRVENQFDGTHETQAAVPVGGSFAYQVRFPDPGVYWYHPHVREDYGQELGLSGAIIVVPAEASYWPAANREVALILDDILIEDGKVAPFSRTETTYAAMGRYGNVCLVNGEQRPNLTAATGEVVRYYLTNTANTRTFNLGFPGARMNVVGGDSGRVEQEAMVESVILAPSERVVIDVLFDTPGNAMLAHMTPHESYLLAGITVGPEPATPALAAAFETLRRNPEWAAERERFAPYLGAAPDKTLAFVAEMSMGDADGAGPFACPMHPEVVSEVAGRCPICGMALLPQSMIAQASGHEMDMGHDMHVDHSDMDHSGHDMQVGLGHMDHSNHDMPLDMDHGAHAGHGHHAEPGTHDMHYGHGAGDGIEWEDDMVEINRATTPANTRWTLVDTETGAANHAIDWHFRVGDLVKIRLINEMNSDHPMQHPFHIHGAGRFVVLARDGEAEQNLVWKDTVLVRTGQTVDILLEVTNPGVWMAHCHIAEHHESGMMLSFHVTG